MRLKALALALAAAILLLRCLTGGAIVGADDSGSIDAGDSGERSVTVSQLGDGHPSTGSAGHSTGTGTSTGAAPICWFESGASADVVVGPFEYQATQRANVLFPIDPTGKSHWLVTHCRYPDGHWQNTVTKVVPDPTRPAPPPPPLTPAQLALRATARLHFTFPALHLSPPGSHTVVGFPTWIWIDAGAWQPITAVDTDAGLTVTLVATPDRLRFDPGDGTDPVACLGPGTPYRAGHGSAWAASPTCGHTYTTPDARHAGGRTVTVATIDWRFDWTASDGTRGTLPDLRLTHREQLTVRAYTTVTN